MKIKAILECLNSETDSSGNRYWAFRFINTETGQQIHGVISGGESNIAAIPREMGYEWDEIYYYRTEMKKREFRYITKEWQYAGCAPKSLMGYIQKEKK